MRWEHLKCAYHHLGCWGKCRFWGSRSRVGSELPQLALRSPWRPSGLVCWWCVESSRSVHQALRKGPGTTTTDVPSREESLVLFSGYPRVPMAVWHFSTYERDPFRHFINQWEEEQHQEHCLGWKYLTMICISLKGKVSTEFKEQNYSWHWGTISPSLISRYSFLRMALVAEPSSGIWSSSGAVGMLVLLHRG